MFKATNAIKTSISFGNSKTFGTEFHLGPIDWRRRQLVTGFIQAESSDN